MNKFGEKLGLIYENYLKELNLVPAKKVGNRIAKSCTSQ